MLVIVLNDDRSAVSAATGCANVPSSSGAISLLLTEILSRVC